MIIHHARAACDKKKEATTKQLIIVDVVGSYSIFFFAHILQLCLLCFMKSPKTSMLSYFVLCLYLLISVLFYEVSEDTSMD